MFNCYWRYLVGVVVAWPLLSAGEATAKGRGFVLVTWGDSVFDLGDVPASSRFVVGADKVGYKYHYVGVFWVDFWTSEGEYCVYQGDRYRTVPLAEAARILGKSEGSLATPFLYR